MSDDTPRKTDDETPPEKVEDSKPLAEDDRARALAAWKRWGAGDPGRVADALEDVSRVRRASSESLDALVRAADEELARKKQRGEADPADELPKLPPEVLSHLLAARKKRRDEEGRRPVDLEPGRTTTEEASRALAAWKQWSTRYKTEEEAMEALEALKRQGSEDPLDELLEEGPIHTIEAPSEDIDFSEELGVRPANPVEVASAKAKTPGKPAGPPATAPPGGKPAPPPAAASAPATSEDMKSRDLVAGLGAGASLADEEENARALAARYRLEYVDLSQFAPEPEMFESVPIDLMFRYNFLPHRKERGRLVVVMADPTDIPVVDEIALLLGVPIQPAVGMPSAIQECLKRGHGSARVLAEAGDSFKLQVVEENERGEEVLSIDKIKQDQSPIVRLIDTVLFDSLSRRASDIHIETQDQEVVIKYRVDGALMRAMKPIAKEHHSAVISRIKVMAELDIAEKRIPQDGRFRVFLQGRKIDFRVSIMPSVHGEDAVIRILDKESLSKQFANLSLDILGYEERELQRFRRLIREPYGMILVTGPTGSGKTTALYGALSEIKSEEDKIITIEDPVEYQLRGVTQIPVNEKKGLTFAKGLRSILRHDPDTIMVGEIRDKETAEIAINSALTGHLVFTTVHANNVIDVLGRFLNIGIEPYNFVSSLNCILAQRLVRTLCANCKHPVSPSPELLAESGLMADSDTVLWEGAGCVECGGTGFKGRTAICELLDLSDRIRELILERKSSAEIKRAAKEEGMVFMREVAVTKALRGETTLAEINKVTFVEAF